MRHTHGKTLPPCSTARMAYGKFFPCSSLGILIIYMADVSFLLPISSLFFYIQPWLCYVSWMPIELFIHFCFLHSMWPPLALIRRMWRWHLALFHMSFCLLSFGLCYLLSFGLQCLLAWCLYWKQVHGTLLITAMAISFIRIGCFGAMQTRSSDVMHPRIVTPTSESCTILPFPAGTDWQFSADILVNCLCISPNALVCQAPFRRKWPHRLSKLRNWNWNHLLWCTLRYCDYVYVTYKICVTSCITMYVNVWKRWRNVSCEFTLAAKWQDTVLRHTVRYNIDRSK